jgi:hypothetical protein
MTIYLYIFLNPFFKAGFYSDDMSNSLSYISNIRGETNLQSRITDLFLKPGPLAGRYYPFSNYAYILFDTIEGNLQSYRIFIFVNIFINIYLIGKLIKFINTDKRVVILPFLIMPIFFQFRIFYDPILSFHALMQITLTFLLISLITLIKFTKTHKIHLLFASYLSFLTSLLLYEISYLMILMHIYVIIKLKIGIKQKLRIILPYILSLTFVVYNQLLQRAQGGIRESYLIDFDLGKIIMTLYNHLYASLPLSYLFSSHGKIFAVTKIDLIRITVIAYILILFLTFIVTKIIKKIWKQNQENMETESRIQKDLLVFGFLFWIIPGVFISFSTIYQYLISFGLSHIPVYISYFGVFLILYFLYTQITSPLPIIIRNLIHGFTSILVILITALNYSNNIKVVQYQNDIYWNSRNVIEKINESDLDLFKELNSKSLLLIQSNDNLSFDIQGFIFSLTKKEILNTDIRRLESWYLENSTDSDTLLADDPRTGVYGKSVLDIEDKFSNLNIFKYSSTYLGDAGFISTSKLQNLEFDAISKRIYVQLEGFDLYMYNLMESDYVLSFLEIKNSLAMEQTIYFSIEYCRNSERGSVKYCYIKLPKGVLIDYGSINVEPVK